VDSDSEIDPVVCEPGSLDRHRRIVHVDMDAFYASVEQRDRPDWKGRPLVVAGDSRRGVVAAASYEARRLGIRSAMPVGQALKLCPHVIRATPRFDVYHQVSHQIHAIFRSYTERLEPLALDESYLDLTEHCLQTGKKAGIVAMEIKRAIRSTTQLTASAGVAPNKLVAKIASGFKKPDGLTIVPPDEVEEFLRPLPIGDMWGVGPVTEKRFLELGIQTVGQLATADAGWLQSHFGRGAYAWQQMARGNDERPVEWSQEPKSVSAERTFRDDVTDLEQLKQALDEQSHEVALRLQGENREATTVQIKLRYSDFTTITRSHTGRRPYSSQADILLAAVYLLERQVPLPPIRLIGVGVSGLLSLRRPRQLELSFD
jgi:DNA polymerase-4